MLLRKLTLTALMATTLIAAPVMAETMADSVTETATEAVKAEKLYYEMKTNKGVIILQLDGEKAPNTVANFKRYADENFFDGLIFHRVIQDFMIQGGGFTADMKHKVGFDPVAIESNNGLKNEKGTIAMARTSDPNSATSQFFINTRDNSFLDYPGQDGHGYTVFGRVISGMDVVSEIEKSKTSPKAGHRDVPVEPIVIEKVTEIDEPLIK